MRLLEKLIKERDKARADADRFQTLIDMLEHMSAATRNGHAHRIADQARALATPAPVAPSKPKPTRKAKTKSGWTAERRAKIADAVRRSWTPERKAKWSRMIRKARKRKAQERKQRERAARAAARAHANDDHARQPVQANA